MTIRFRRWGLAVATIAIALLSLAAPAFAQAPDLTLSTKYPGMTVRPGENLNLTLEVSNAGGPAIATIEVTQFPDGWEPPSLRGGGFAVNQVFVGPGKTETVTLDLKVPEQVAEGIYTVVLTASADGDRSTLPLQLKVARTAASRATLTTQYPSIQAQAGTTYTFRVDLRNDSDVKQMFALSANAPKGWNVTFKPAYESKQIGTIPVDAHASQGIDVEIQVPSEVDAGTYKIPIIARSGSTEAALELELQVMGKYALSVSTPSGRLSFDATAGRENHVTIEVKNTGTAPLESITLSASTPSNWKVTFSPDKLDALEPGESRQVTATVQPDSKAIAGDYLLTITATAGDYSARGSAEFRVAVKTSTLWGVAGLTTLAAVAGSLWWVFRTFGRR